MILFSLSLKVHFPDVLSVAGGDGVPPHPDHLQRRLPPELFQSVLSLLCPHLLPLPVHLPPARPLAT